MATLFHDFISLVQASFGIGKEDVDFFCNTKIASFSPARECMGPGFDGPVDFRFLIGIFAFPNVRGECG